MKELHPCRLIMFCNIDLAASSRPATAAATARRSTNSGPCSSAVDRHRHPRPQRRRQPRSPPSRSCSTAAADSNRQWRSGNFRLDEKQFKKFNIMSYQFWNECLSKINEVILKIIGMLLKLGNIWKITCTDYLISFSFFRCWTYSNEIIINELPTYLNTLC